MPKTIGSAVAKAPEAALTPLPATLSAAPRVADPSVTNDTTAAKFLNCEIIVGNNLLTCNKDTLPQPRPVSNKICEIKRPRSVLANCKNPFAIFNTTFIKSFDITLFAKSWKVAFNFCVFL